VLESHESSDLSEESSSEAYQGGVGTVQVVEWNFNVGRVIDCNVKTTAAENGSVLERVNGDDSSKVVVFDHQRYKFKTNAYEVWLIILVHSVVSDFV